MTLAETTPVLEAQELQGDLERAGIHQIAEVHTLTDRFAPIPLLSEEPMGEEKVVAPTGLSSLPA